MQWTAKVGGGADGAPGEGCHLGQVGGVSRSGNGYPLLGGGGGDGGGAGFDLHRRGGGSQLHQEKLAVPHPPSVVQPTSWGKVAEPHPQRKSAGPSPFHRLNKPSWPKV